MTATTKLSDYTIDFTHKDGSTGTHTVRASSLGDAIFKLAGSIEMLVLDDCVKFNILNGTLWDAINS